MTERQWCHLLAAMTYYCEQAENQETASPSEVAMWNRAYKSVANDFVDVTSDDMRLIELGLGQSIDVCDNEERITTFGSVAAAERASKQCEAIRRLI